MGSPAQLTKPQVAALKAKATGKPAQQKNIRIGKERVFDLCLPLRENDVYLVELIRRK